MGSRKPAVLESKNCKQKLNEFKSRCNKHEQARKETKPVGVFATFKKILRLKNKFCNLLLFPEKKSSK